MLLFVIPADADDIKEEYNILLNELIQYNPELADKQRLLAISKTDLLDDELKEAIAENLPDIPYVFISAVTNSGLSQLKDMLWKELNAEVAPTAPKEDKSEKDSLVHRNLDVKSVVFDDDDDDVALDDFEEDNDDDDYEEDYS